MTSQLAVNISIFGLCNYAFQMTQQERDNKVSGNIWNLCNLLGGNEDVVIRKQMVIKCQMAPQIFRWIVYVNG